MPKAAASRAAAARRMLRLLGCLPAAALLAGVAFGAPPISTAPYFPLQAGNSWVYRVNGVETRTRSISGTLLVNGALTVVESESPTSDQVYLTNDAQGIRQHGNLDGASAGLVTLSPPVIYAPAEVNLALPPFISQSGTATISGPGIPFPIALGYSSSSQFLGIEDISVQGRSYRAAHLRVSLTASGFVGPTFFTETDSDDIWVVERVGIVKQIMAVTSNVEPPSTDTYELLSTNVARSDPEPFAFPSQGGVPPDTLVTSGAIGVVNTTADSAISISGGEYSIDGGPFTAAPGSIANGQSVRVRVLSPTAFGATATAILNIGGIGGAFSVTTVAEDATPAPFAFAPVTAARPGAVVTSGAIVVAGINTSVPVTVTGGEYSIDGGPFTAAPGSIGNGQSVRVRVVSPTAFGATATATLSIGGVSAEFTVGTMAPAKRAFVASFGADASVCSLAAPCRTLGAAVAVADSGGEVLVLDSAGYGPVAVARPVSIIAPPGIYAGVTVAGGDGITVNVAPGERVVLRGLTVNGQGGSRGIVVQGGAVHIENCVVANMGADGILVQGGRAHISGSLLRSNARWGLGVTGAAEVQVSGTRIARNGGSGIHVEAGGGLVLERVRLEGNGAAGVSVSPAASSSSVVMRRSSVSGNAGTGVSVTPASGATAHVTVEGSSAVAQGGHGFALLPAAGAGGTLTVNRSTAADNGGAGIGASGSSATVYVRDSTVLRNATGLSQADAAVLNTCGSNLVALNGVQASGTISGVACNQ